MTTPGGAGVTAVAGLAGRLPRISSRDKPTDQALNTLPIAVDDLGVSLKVRRATPSALAANVDYLLTWNAVSFDTRGDMFSPADPNTVTIRVSGVYRVHLQARFAAAGVANAGSGVRWIRILRGATAVGQGTGNDRQPAVGTSEGLTLIAGFEDRLFAGETLTALVGSSAAVTGLQNDHGGTHMIVTRMGPLTSS